MQEKRRGSMLRKSGHERSKQALERNEIGFLLKHINFYAAKNAMMNNIYIYI